MFRVGRFIFVNREYYQRLLDLHIIKEYDVSPEAREAHEREAEFRPDESGCMVRIKLTDEDRKRAVRDSILNKEIKKYRPVETGEAIVNPWIK